MFFMFQQLWDRKKNLILFNSVVIFNILSCFYFRARKRNKNPSRKIESTSCKKQEYFKRTSRAEAVASNNAKTSSSPEGGAVSD